MAVWCCLAAILFAPLPGCAQRSGDELLPVPLADYPHPAPLLAAKSALSFEDRVMELINEERWINGQLPPLKRNALLDAAAELHSGSMASRNFFAHCDLDTGTYPWDRAALQGYSGLVGENIAVGSASPEAAVNLWMGSPGHRAAILSTGFREVGVGYAFDPGDAAGVRENFVGTCVQLGTGGPWSHYWTLNFGEAPYGYPVVIDREAPSTESRNVQLYVYGGALFPEMRIRNESGSFTPWQPHAEVVSWTLSPGNGVKTVIVEMRSSFSITASDTIVLGGVPPPEVFADGFESGTTGAWSP